MNYINRLKGHLYLPWTPLPRCLKYWSVRLLLQDLPIHMAHAFYASNMLLNYSSHTKQLLMNLQTRKVEISDITIITAEVLKFTFNFAILWGEYSQMKTHNWTKWQQRPVVNGTVGNMTQYISCSIGEYVWIHQFQILKRDGSRMAFTHKLFPFWWRVRMKWLSPSKSLK